MALELVKVKRHSPRPSFGDNERGPLLSTSPDSLDSMRRISPDSLDNKSRRILSNSMLATGRGLALDSEHNIPSTFDSSPVASLLHSPSLAAFLLR